MKLPGSTAANVTTPNNLLVPKIPSIQLTTSYDEIVPLSVDENSKNINSVKSKVKIKRRPILARTVLWHLTFVGFAVHYMIRINMNITIVDMVVPRRNQSSSIGMECFENYSRIEMSVNSQSSIGRALPGSNMTKVRYSFERKLLDALHVS